MGVSLAVVLPLLVVCLTATSSTAELVSQRTLKGTQRQHPAEAQGLVPNGRTTGGDYCAPKVAGAFYDADADSLRYTLDQCFSSPFCEEDPRLPPQARHQAPVAVLVPHAGIKYSGPVAACSYRLLKGVQFDRVVVVAFFHQLSFPGVFSPCERSSYRTPLGDVPMDLEALHVLSKVSAGSPAATVTSVHPSDVHPHGSNPATSSEHSAEVQLPFLQYVKAIPRHGVLMLLMGRTDDATASSLADSLRLLQQALPGRYLFVFSSDLSHFNPYNVAMSNDQETLDNMVQMSSDDFVGYLGQKEAAQPKDSTFVPCGEGPILTALHLGDLMGGWDKAILSLANSGDTAGDRKSVVGYGAVAMWPRIGLTIQGLIEGGKAPPNTKGVDLDAILADVSGRNALGQAMLMAARAQVMMCVAFSDACLRDEDELIHENRPLRRLESVMGHVSEESRKRGLFVTLWKKDDNNRKLRGCVGCIEPGHCFNSPQQTIEALLPRASIEACRSDDRFQPVAKEELPLIWVEVSLLTRPEPCTADSIQPGSGVFITFDNTSKYHGHDGVFLPSVWDNFASKDDFMADLCIEKAKVPSDAWKKPGALFRCFKASVFEEDPQLVLPPSVFRQGPSTHKVILPPHEEIATKPPYPDTGPERLSSTGPVPIGLGEPEEGSRAAAEAQAHSMSKGLVGGGIKAIRLPPGLSEDMLIGRPVSQVMKQLKELNPGFDFVSNHEFEQYPTVDSPTFVRLLHDDDGNVTRLDRV